MQKKSYRVDTKSNDIELPLLSDHKKTPNAPLKHKKKLIDFFRADSPPSKYIQKLPFFKFLTLSDIFPLIKLANSRPTNLTVDDLPFPFKFSNVEKKIIELDAEWEAGVKSNKPSIIRAVFNAYKREIAITLLLGFILISSKLTSALLLGKIINNITKSSFGMPMDYEGTFFLTCLLTMVSMVVMLCVAWCWHYIGIVCAQLRNVLVGFMYKKLQNVALSSLQEISIGKVINLLSNDVNEIEKDLIYLMPLALAPYTLGLGGFLLWKQFGYATIFGILGLVLPLLFSQHLSKKTINLRSEKKVMTDERIKMTNELVECIRLIKMYAWEKFFKQKIETLRDNEALKMVRFKMIEAVGRSVSEISPQISIVMMCLVYIWNDGQLSTEKVYTGLMVLNFVGIWGIMFCHSGIMFIGTGKVIAQRFENLLSVKDISDVEDDSRLSGHIARAEPGTASSSPDFVGQGSITIKNYNARWNKDDLKPCLKDINLTLRPGELTAIIGSIGSGKSSFLLSFLNEIPIIQGEFKCKGTVAYVEQEPTIFSGTVRSNIIFGLEYDEALYKKVIRACNLHEDFKQFQYQDLTLVGERGTTLSGGQKARVSLARALYSQSDIYLLDDPLSAVDSRVGRHLFHYAIQGDLLKDKIVLLVTHHLNYAKEADRVLLFSEGRIIADGPFEQIRSSESGLFAKFTEIEDEAQKRKESTKKSSIIKGMSDVIGLHQEPTQKEEKEENDEINSKVTWSTYINYIKQNGDFWPFIILIASFVFYGVTGIVFSRFIGYWGQAHSSFYFNKSAQENNITEEVFDNSPYVIGCIVFIMLLILGSCAESILSNIYLTKANTNMHQKILDRMIRAKVLFYDKTPVGSILNRFSNDLGILDSTNASLLIGVFDGLMYLGFRMITLLLINIAFIIPLTILLAVLKKVRKFFQKLILDVKRIDLASKSPLYSEISATINGLVTIRAYRQGGAFIQKFCELLYNSYRASFYADRSLRFMAFTISGAFETLTLSGTFICIFAAYYTQVEAGLFGLTLLLLQELTTYGNWFIRTSLIVDINMQSVERIFQLYEVEQEAPKYIPNRDDALIQQSSKWPSSGQVTFQNVYMKYRPEFDFVLRGLSFNIQGGQKVGIIGRTGAGKSSIIQALFRTTEIESIPGSSIQVDGEDVSKLGLDVLRKNLSIIPQTPMVFTGSIKRNLDPFGEYSDDDLWLVLEEVNLKKYVASLENKLETDMSVSNSVFSVGQKQLICLARAILRKSKIILLDEATANVDIETDDFIQNTIMRKFKDSTVITIAHRLITIANYDRVLVMDKGMAVEFDSPYRLLVENEEDDSITNSKSVFAQMVKVSGESVSRKIFSAAKAKFDESG